MSRTPSRQWWIAPVLLVMVSAFAAAQTAKSTSGGSGTEQQVRAAQEQLLQAAQQGNKDGVSSIVTDDLTWIGADGKLMTRDQMLGMLPAPVNSVDVTRIQLLGKAAILTGVAHLKDGTETRFLQEWVNSDGQWKLNAHQGTRTGSTSTAMQTGTAGMSGTNPPTATSGEASSTVPPAGTSGSGVSSNTAMSGSRSTTVEPTLKGADERAVWKANEALMNAYSKGDAKTYSKYTAPDYSRVMSDGSLLGKTEYLRTIQENGSKSAGQLNASDVQIAVDGKTARLIQVTDGTLPGGETEHSRMTRIFEKRNGQWQQVALITTPIKP